MSSKTHKRFWDLHAAWYDIAWDSPTTSRVACAALGDDRPLNIVDLGCGTGLFSKPASSAAHVTGVDTSPQMLERALQRDRVQRTILADAHRTGLPSGGSEFVLCANLLHLHHDPRLVIHEAARITMPGGKIAFVIPSLPLHPNQVLIADLRAGRSPPEALAAHVIRIATGLAARFSSIQAKPIDHLVPVVRQAAHEAELTRISEESFDGTQLLLVFQKIH